MEFRLFYYYEGCFVRPSYSARLAIIDKERTKNHEKEID